MNLQLQIYVDTSGSPLVEVPIYERLDLFDFEAVELTSTIQDAQDIGEVFTDFSQTFKVPASKRNNKVFTHFYQSDLNTGFDSRIKQRAKLELGGISFRNGFISLTESNVKNGNAESYSITFYGAIVSLKEIIGDDELKSLIGLDKFNHEYNLDNVWDGFRIGLGLNSSNEMVFSGDRDIIYPSISFQNDWYYSTSDPIGTKDDFNQGESKNLRIDSNTLGQYGIEFNELKPAIKVKRIIEAIELTYSTIQFGGGFFESSDFGELYLLLNKNEGSIKNEGVLFESIVNNFTVGQDNVTDTRILTPSTLQLYGQDVGFEYLEFTLTLNTLSSLEYNAIITKNGNEIYRGPLTGTQTIDVASYLDSVTLNPFLGDFNIYISAETSITFSSIDWFVKTKYTVSGSSLTSTKTWSTGITPFSNSFDIEVPRQMPKMKTLDFLRGLFKMFNLTAYYQNGIIVVDTLDDFYSDGDTIDLTKSLDNGEINVKRSKLYSDINFQFAEPKTFGVINQNEQNQDNFGNLEFQTLPDGKNSSLAFDGTKYEIKLPFEKGFFERMNDQDAATFTLTDFSNGWIVDKNQETTDIAPMLFYNVPTIIDSNTWKFGFVGKSNYITTFNRGSNSNLGASKSLQFGSEIDEYTGNINANSLFAIGYQNYVTNLFSINTRILSAEFYLGLDVLTQYKLNDKIRLKGKDYRINSIKSNLNTGKSTLELITSYD